MLKFFFNLYFQYTPISEISHDNLTSTFNLGYYSSKKKAQEAISFYKQKQGFCDFGLDCFKIQKLGVDFENIIDKEQAELFELTYEGEDIEGNTDWVLFGLFSTEELAREEQLKQQVKRKYRNNIFGFQIEKWEVNNSLPWQDGFNKI